VESKPESINFKSYYTHGKRGVVHVILRTDASLVKNAIAGAG
jgi:hypothetical protein